MTSLHYFMSQNYFWWELEYFVRDNLGKIHGHFNKKELNSTVKTSEPSGYKIAIKNISNFVIQREKTHNKSPH